MSPPDNTCTFIALLFNNFFYVSYKWNQDTVTRYLRQLFIAGNEDFQWERCLSREANKELCELMASLRYSWADWIERWCACRLTGEVALIGQITETAFTELAEPASQFHKPWARRQSSRGWLSWSCLYSGRVTSRWRSGVDDYRLDRDGGLQEGGEAQEKANYKKLASCYYYFPGYNKKIRNENLAGHIIFQYAPRAHVHVFFFPVYYCSVQYWLLSENFTKLTIFEVNSMSIYNQKFKLILYNQFIETILLELILEFFWKQIVLYIYIYWKLLWEKKNINNQIKFK